MSKKVKKIRNKLVNFITKTTKNCEVQLAILRQTEKTIKKA